MTNEPMNNPPRKSTQPCTTQAEALALLVAKMAEGQTIQKAARETIIEASGRITDVTHFKLLDWVSLGKAFEALHTAYGAEAVACFISNLRFDTKVKAPKSIGRSLNSDWINKQLGAG